MKSILAGAATILAVCCTVPAAWAQQADGGVRDLKLVVGSQRELRLNKPLERVAIGNPAVADALLLKSGSGANGVLVVAKKPGATELMVWPRGEAAQTYRVQVDATRGESGDPAVAVSGGGALISGEARDAQASLRAQLVARSATATAEGKGGVVIDRSTIPVSSTVQVDVKVVEVSKTVLKEVGFNFYRNNGGFAFGTFSPSSLNKFTFTPRTDTTPGSFSADISSPMSSAFNLVAASLSHGIFANLSLLESNGMARVLAEPSLVALSGQSASFLAGGEIPIPVPQALGTTTIQFKPFGIGLTVTPTVLAKDRIALKVAPEASDLDPSRGISINGAMVPAIVTRRADTTVELGDGESFVIGGLVSRTTVSNVNKVPLLGDLPIIGTFFRNLNFNQEDRELMIVVTPRLVRPLAKGAAAVAAVSEDGRTSGNPDVWGRFVLGEYVDPTLPGFSK